MTDMAPRLKLFEWSDGFHRFTVAAASRPKALAAWGTRQDIFASGLAREAPDAEDAEAARARPGEVIERRLTVDISKAGPVHRDPGHAREGRPPNSVEPRASLTSWRRSIRPTPKARQPFAPRCKASRRGPPKRRRGLTRHRPGLFETSP